MGCLDKINVMAIFGVAALTGCGSVGMQGDIGVTPGGSQDIDYARELIANGMIPLEGDFSAEGLFSEHNLPLTGTPCNQILCPRAAATTIDPIDDSGPQTLVQLGFGTSMNEMERPPLNLAIAVDVSGSMTGDKIEAVRDAMHAVVDQLDEDDTMALIKFATASKLVKGRTKMDSSGRQAMDQAIDRLKAGGGTNIEKGLEQAYGQVAPQAGNKDLGHRVMLLTDAQPNIGATDVDSFLGMARLYGASGIGISIFGVGLDLGSELAQEVSKVRGGNYFYLEDADAIRQVFTEEFDYIVTPLAYDLQVNTETVNDDYALNRAFGAPLDDLSAEVDFGASTLFPSKRQGGIGVTFFGAGPEVATLSLSYLPVGDNTYVEEELVVEANTEQPGVTKMAVLLDEFLALETGAAYCAGTLDNLTAEARIEEAALRLAELSDTLGDDPLYDEALLMEALRDNIGNGTCNGGY
ncbi:MAG: VWA domain-containing protein [Proteobacteria bacterium]|nr:VWA domain-containing protein [Pseudomonadota bacterium]